MRSPALKQILVLFTLVILICAATCEARSPVAIRLIAGASQAGVHKINGVTDDPGLLLGLGAKYRLNNRHSFFLDIERIERKAPSASANAYLSDFQLSREPLTAPDYVSADYWPVTLGYQFNILSDANHWITPHVMCGVSMMVIAENTHDGSIYPNLDVSSDEEIERSSTKASAKFGATIGVGCSVKVSSALSLSLNGCFRELGTTKPRSVESRTVESGRRTVNPFWPLPLNDGYEAKLIIEFRI